MKTINNLKSILILAALVAVLVAAGCAPALSTSNTENMREVADQIAGYELPEGYSEQFAADAFGYEVISMVGPIPSCHIYLVQTPEKDKADIEKMQAQAQSVTADKDRPEDMQLVEERTVTIRGMEVTLLVQEGINSDGDGYRDVSALFDGRNGPALVSISSPSGIWDWDLVNNFLASIN